MRALLVPFCPKFETSPSTSTPLPDCLQPQQRSCIPCYTHCLTNWSKSASGGFFFILLVLAGLVSSKFRAVRGFVWTKKPRRICEGHGGIRNLMGMVCITLHVSLQYGGGLVTGPTASQGQVSTATCSPFLCLLADLMSDAPRIPGVLEKQNTFTHDHPLVGFSMCSFWLWVKFLCCSESSHARAASYICTVHPGPRSRKPFVSNEHCCTNMRTLLLRARSTTHC